jgi:PhnB protein
MLASSPSERAMAKSKTDATSKPAGAAKRAVKPVPEGNHTVTPYLIVDDARKAIAFYEKAFLAKTLGVMPGPKGRVMHAEIQVGDSRVMLADEFPEMGAKSPKAYGGSPISIALYVPDVDVVVERALKAGGTLRRPVEDQFYGDRSGAVTDPFGHVWHVSTHVEDVSHEEMQRRMEALHGAKNAKKA